MDWSGLEDLADRDLEVLPLEEIAFLVARERYADLDAGPYRERLDEFARRAHLRIGGVLGGRQIAEGLSHYLFDDEGFRGNTSDYYNPSNSYLNDVMDSRSGIPITLSILYIAIARRLGMNVVGVSFPGHFLARLEAEGEALIIDPFHRGKVLTEQGCRERLEEMYGGKLAFRPEYLEPVRHREVLLRMLTNLKLIALMNRDYSKALQFLNRILLFKPDGFGELKERGLVGYHLECFGPALKDLDAYLRAVPNDPDRPDLEAYLQDLREKVDRII